MKHIKEKEVSCYTTHDVQKRASVDGVMSGTDMSEDNSPSQIELSDKVYSAITKFLSSILNASKKPSSKDGFMLKPDSVVKKQDAGYYDTLGFVLTDGIRSLQFTMKRAGARGRFLNAWWNPNKFLSGGQNVFPAVTECSRGNRALDVEWTYLPHFLVEYPFVMLSKFLDEVCGEHWPGRKTINTSLQNHDVFWQRLDFTVYSAELSNADYILGAMEVAAKTKNFTNLFGRERDEKCSEMSLQSLLNIGFEDDGGNSRGYSYVRLNKFVESKGRGRKPTAFSICFYLKENEVRDTRDSCNLKAIKAHPNVVSSRLRQEFTFYASSMMKISSIKGVLLGKKDKYENTEECAPLNIRKSKALLELFPTEVVFREKMNQLMVVAMQEMSLDWLLTPKNPHGVAERAYRATGDSLVRDLLLMWQDLGTKALPSPRDTFNSKKFQASAREIINAYKLIESNFADVHSMSFAACQMLYFNMVRACLSEKEYLEVQKLETFTSLSREQSQRRATLMDSATAKFNVLKKELKNTIGYEPLKSNLLGE